MANNAGKKERTEAGKPRQIKTLLPLVSHTIAPLDSGIIKQSETAALARVVLPFDQPNSACYQTI